MADPRLCRLPREMRKIVQEPWMSSIISKGLILSFEETKNAIARRDAL